jgi:hypothetical protein
MSDQGSGGQLGSVTLSAVGAGRIQLAWQHLNAASLFSRQVGALEASHQGDEYAQFFEEIFAYATGCIMCATAGLEAFTNQVFADRAIHFTAVSTDLLDELWEKLIDRKSNSRQALVCFVAETTCSIRQR